MGFISFCIRGVIFTVRSGLWILLGTRKQQCNVSPQPPVFKGPSSSSIIFWASRPYTHQTMISGSNQPIYPLAGDSSHSKPTSTQQLQSKLYIWTPLPPTSHLEWSRSVGNQVMVTNYKEFGFSLHPLLIHSLELVGSDLGG